MHLLVHRNEKKEHVVPVRAQWFVEGMKIPEEDRRVVERAASKEMNLKGQLRENPYLTPATWSDLFDPKGKVGDVLPLVDRELSRAQRDRVLATEKRSKVILALLAKNSLDDDEIDSLLSRKALPAQVASHFLEKATLTSSQRRAAAWHVGGIDKLRWLASSNVEDFSDEDLVRELAWFSQWAPKTDDKGRGYTGQKNAFDKLLNRRPGLVSAVVDNIDSKDVCQVVAGHSSLRKVEDQLKVAGFTFAKGPTPEAVAERRFLFMALVNNPPTDPRIVKMIGDAAVEAKMVDLARSATKRLLDHPHAVTTPYSQLDNPQDLEWVIKRSLPYWDHMGKLRVRPYDMLDLLANHNLSDEQARKLIFGVDDVSQRFDRSELLGAIRLVRDLHPEVMIPAYLREEEEEETPTWDSQVEDQPNPWERLLDPKTVHLANLHYGNVVSTSWTVHAELGADEKRWELFFNLVDTFDGTLADLMDLTRFI